MLKILDEIKNNLQFSHETSTTILKATFLLFISIAGNFLAETLGCKTQLYLDNMIIKHILILFMIYFTINFTQGDEIVSPFVNLRRAIIVWVLFHLFTHLDIVPTVVVLVLLVSLYFISNYSTYLEKTNKKNTSLSKTLKRAEEVLYFLSIAVIVLGFLYYYFEKKQEYGKRFNILKFIFGVKKCKSLK